MTFNNLQHYEQKYNSSKSHNSNQQKLQSRVGILRYKNSKKTVQQRELTNADDLNPFRENIAHSDEIGIMRESGVVLTAVRIYKGNEIIYDKYCVNNELETLLVLFNHK